MKQDLARSLGIPSKMAKAFYELADDLEAGRIAHFQCANGWSYARQWPTHGEHFSMHIWSCGTVSCIGGHIERRTGVDIQNLKSSSLDRLCFDWGCADPTPQEAAHAIRNYLSGSQDPWR